MPGWIFRNYFKWKNLIQVSFKVGAKFCKEVVGFFWWKCWKFMTHYVGSRNNFPCVGDVFEINLFLLLKVYKLCLRVILSLTLSLPKESINAASYSRVIHCFPGSLLKNYWQFSKTSYCALQKLLDTWYIPAFRCYLKFLVKFPRNFTPWKERAVFNVGYKKIEKKIHQKFTG